MPSAYNAKRKQKTGGTAQCGIHRTRLNARSAVVLCKLSIYGRQAVTDKPTHFHKIYLNLSMHFKDKLNKPQIETIKQLYAFIRYGTQRTDIIVRKDGVEKRFEADWIKDLLDYVDET